MGFLGDVDDFFREEGEQFGNLLPEFLHKASNFACELYRQKPGIIYDLNFFNQGLWDKLCRPRPPGLPPSPQPDFQGGQCPVYYAVAFQSHAGTSDGTDTPILGPIAGIRIEHRQHPRFGSWAWYLLISAPGAINLDFYEGMYWRTASASYNFPDPKPPKPILIGVNRMDGQPDNCGNLPSPDIPPIVVPPGERSTNITYTNNEGNRNFNIPIVLIFPTLNNTFNLNPSLTIEAKIGGGDRTINFHLYPDGWYSEPGHPAEPPIPDPKIDYFINPPNPDDDPLLRPSPPSPPADFAADEDLPGARWLRVTLTKLPDKAQYGRNTPNVYFAGWMEFTKGGDCLERKQINFEKSLFRFPDGADGFYVQFTNGAQGSYITYTEVPDA